MSRYAFLQNIKPIATHTYCKHCGNSLLSDQNCSCNIGFFSDSINLNSGQVGRLWGADFIVSPQLPQMAAQQNERQRIEQVMAAALSVDRNMAHQANSWANPIRRNLDYR